MRRSAVVGCAFLFLAAAPAARAEVTIGSTLEAPADTEILCGGCSVAATSVPEPQTVAPMSGVITRWRIKAGTGTASARLLVIRRPQGTGDNVGAVVSRSAPVEPPADAVTATDVRIPIAVGEYIGLECCELAGGYFAAASEAWTADVWLPPLDVALEPPGLTPLPWELLVNADIEPDLDGDGFGDETQDDDDDGDGVPDAGDACPAEPASTSDGCPPAPPAAPRVNTPPVVRFRTPLAGTAVGASQPIELDVSDDAGNPTVTVFDDDGTVCTLSGPPYSCTWSPTGADVGRATLLASAVDSDNRSTLGSVRVKVARFEGDLTRRVRGRRVTGRLVLPPAVERSLGCRGQVTVRRGRKIRNVALKRNCSYSARLPRGRGKVRARFAGNPVVEPAT